jgi:competence protein ComEC
MTPVQLYSLVFSLGIIYSRTFLPPSGILMFLIIFLSVYLFFFRAKNILLGICSLLFVVGAYNEASSFHITAQILSPLVKVAEALRGQMIDVLVKTMPKDQAALLGSIILGTGASPVPADVTDAFRATGLVHLVVVSGAQVSIVVSSAEAIFSKLGLSRSMKFLAVTIANMFFMLMTGMGPSIVRASIMSQVMLTGHILGRSKNIFNTISFSWLVLMLIDPNNMFSLGCQLSFMATVSLIYVAPILSDHLEKGFFRKIAAPLSVSLGPVLITSPLILYNFGQVSFISMISNFVVVPWIEIVVVTGFISMMIGIFFLPIALIINSFLSVSVILIEKVTIAFAGVPFAQRFFAPPGLLQIGAYYIIIFTMLSYIKNGNIGKHLKVAFNISLAIIIVSTILSFGCFAGKELKVTVINVGQGDSILVETPSGKNMLIDGGGRMERNGYNVLAAKAVVLPYLQRSGINALDVVVLTHPHDDHLAGLPYILERMKVKKVFDPGIPHPSRAYSNFLTLIKNKNIPYVLGRTGGTVDLGPDIKVSILSPSEPFIGGSDPDLNENSIVMRLVYGGTSFYFAGDSGFKAEQRILGSGVDIKSNVLKVGHHGSAYATSFSFLNAVRPSFAAISVAAVNSYGHPSRTTIDRLVQAGSLIYMTSEKGNITFTSDGKNITVNSEK